MSSWDIPTLLVSSWFGYRLFHFAIFLWMLIILDYEISETHKKFLIAGLLVFIPFVWNLFVIWEACYEDMSLDHFNVWQRLCLAGDSTHISHCHSWADFFLSKNTSAAISENLNIWSNLLCFKIYSNYSLESYLVNLVSFCLDC